MQSSQDESIYWKLLESVQPLFASDIPWVAQDGSSDNVTVNMSLWNTGNLIKACIKEIPIHIRVETVDTFDRFGFSIIDDLCPFLLTLQDLIHENIMEHVCVSEVECPDQSLLKLSSLSYKIRNSSSNAASDTTQHFNYLCLKQHPGNLRKVFYGIEHFSKRLAAKTGGSALPQMTSRIATHNPPPWLLTNLNPPYWNSSKTLFQTLVSNLGSCKSSTHSAMLSLQGLDPPKEQDGHADFNILLPTCPEDDYWLETFCRILYKNPSKYDVENEMSAENICEAVKTANDYGLILNVQIHEENIQLSCDKPLKYPEAIPTTTLSQLLMENELLNLRVFHLKDRWTLARNLAQSLLQLYDGPWLQTLWTSDDLFFLCESAGDTRKLYNIHNPFILSTLSNIPPSLPRPSHFDKYPLLLSFGQFLLELANGEKLSITKTKSGDYSPYKTLLDNFNETNTGSLSDDYKEAIEGCLKFQKFLKDEKGPNEQVRIRATIFKKIVTPLERNLRLFSKISVSENADITKGSGSEVSLNFRGPNRSYLKDILLTAPNLSHPLREETSYPDHNRKSGSGLLESSEHCGLDYLTINSRNSSTSYVSHFRQDLCNILSITKEQATPFRLPRMEMKAELYRDISSSAVKTPKSYCKQTGNYDILTSLEPEMEINEAEGRLCGGFDITEAGTQEFTSIEWSRTFTILSQTYNDYFQYMSTDEPVKVAILDTGVDYNHKDFQYPRSRVKRNGSICHVKGENTQNKRIKARYNFCDDRSNAEDVTDIDGHGTHVAGIILQLAPTSELYIARVCQGDERYGNSSSTPKMTMLTEKPTISVGERQVEPGRVERAIDWAIRQGVQLINMSFGYKSWDEKLDQALKKARDHGIVIFAAASNSGNYEKVAWPARDPERTICVHSSIDFGTYSSVFTPRAHSDTVNFMVIGEQICSHWPESKGGGFRKMSGTSAATPVATSIAALLLAFTHQSVVNKETKASVEKEIGRVRLQDLRSMRCLLKHICTEADGYYWISPRLLWDDFGVTKMREDPSAASKHAWEEIRRALRR